VTALSVLAVVFAGLLAGEEFIVRWGVAPALRTLPDAAHLRVRIALVRRLRVVVPALIVPTVLTTAAVALLAAPGALGWAALATVLVFVAISAFGTVPINMQVADWDPDDPPSSWRATVARWETLDVLRSSTAVAGFVLLAIAVV
jgi:hypothetical protein